LRGGSKKMALERQPKYAAMDPNAIKEYRPPGEWVGKWHTVLPKENFVTIASRYGVAAEQIIQLNFPGAIEANRVVPEIVNWYLHYHVDFQGSPETFDRKNRMFKGGELLAIPKRVITLHEIELYIQRPKDDQFRIPKLDGFGDLFTGEKFAHEFKVPPKDPAECGYFLVQLKLSIEGEFTRKVGGLAKVQAKKDQIKVQLETELQKDFKGGFSVKMDEKTIDAVAKEIQKGSVQGFIRALAAPFELSLKQSYKFGDLSLVPELGAEFSITPLMVRLSGDYKTSTVFQGVPVDLKGVIKGGFNVGLSKAGWAEVAKRVGWETIKRFLTGAGGTLTSTWQWLLGEGVVTTGATTATALTGLGIVVLVNTVAISSLTAIVVANAGRKGELRGLVPWYSSAFVAKVFYYPRPTGTIMSGQQDAKFRDELVAMGEKDAVALADEVIRELNESGKYPTEAAKLGRLKEIVISVLGNGNYATAEQTLKNRLNEEVTRKLGL
jgi:hypothetical protein